MNLLPLIALLVSCLALAIYISALITGIHYRRQVQSDGDAASENLRKGRHL